MPSPFPGMDPYLEDPELWPGVHAGLIVSLQRALVPLVRPKYHVLVEERVYEGVQGEVGIVGDVAVVGRPDLTRPGGGTNGYDGGQGARREGHTTVLTVELPKPVEIRERYLQIRHAISHEVVTLVEILSPTNKPRGRGREEYEKKRSQIAGTTTNLVEIDLLRAGEPFPVLHQGVLVDRAAEGDYRILISRGARGHVADLYLVSICEPLPSIAVPLRPEDQEPSVDLQSVLESVYDGGGFDALLDYRQEPVTPLSDEGAAWADQLLRQQGLR